MKILQTGPGVEWGKISAPGTAVFLGSDEMTEMTRAHSQTSVSLSLSCTDGKVEVCHLLLGPDMEETQSAREKLEQACPVLSPRAGGVPRGHSPAANTATLLLCIALSYLQLNNF